MTSWIDVIGDAKRQARALGSAYLRMKPDGSLELLDPGSILLKPKEKDEIAAIQAATAGMTEWEYRDRFGLPWLPMGYALGNEDEHIFRQFTAEHPGFKGELKIYPPDEYGFRKLEFRGSTK